MILKKARALKKIEFSGHTICIGPDYAKHMAAIQKRILDLRPRMCALNMRYVLLYSARMLVPLNSRDISFTDPNELAGFLDQCEGSSEANMDVSPAVATTSSRTSGSPVKQQTPSANRWAALFKEHPPKSSHAARKWNRPRSPRMNRRNRSYETLQWSDADLPSPIK